MKRTPAYVLRQFLLSIDSLGLSAPIDLNNPIWSTFYSELPDDQDQTVVFYDTPGGRADGRIMRTGETVRHPAVQIRVRALNYPDASERIGSIANFIDTVENGTISIDGDLYTIEAINRYTDVLPLPEESRKRRVSLFFNLRMTLSVQEGGGGADMAINAVIKNSATIGGKASSLNRTIPGARVLNVDVQVPKALAATLTLRTSNTVGTLTITGTNTITTGQILDLYFANGQQHSVVAGTVSGQLVPISGGIGQNLPALNSACQVAVQQNYPFPVVGNNIQAMSLYTQSYGIFDFLTSVPADALSTSIFPSGAAVLDAAGLYEWYTDGVVPANMVPNPLAGATVATVSLSHNDTTGPKQMTVQVLLQP